MMKKLSHLDWLESEAIHIMREVAGQCANPVLLFSGGKDSLCLLRIAEKAFRPKTLCVFLELQKKPLGLVAFLFL